MKIKIALTLATWFGSGNLKPASGTWGTLAAFPLSFTCAFYGGLTLLIPMILILFFVGLWAAHIYEVEKNEHDCSHVVIDEACGITIAVIPIIIDPSYWVILSSFILFRIFDALKVGLVGWCDKNVSGAFGVMIDDVVAGLLTMITIMGIILWIK